MGRKTEDDVRMYVNGRVKHGFNKPWTQLSPRNPE